MTDEPGGGIAKLRINQLHPNQFWNKTKIKKYNGKNLSRLHIWVFISFILDLRQSSISNHCNLVVNKDWLWQSKVFVSLYFVEFAVCMINVQNVWV